MHQPSLTAISRYHSWLKQQNLDAVIVNSKQNKFAHTGLLSASGYVFITRTSQHILVDSRYIQELSAKSDDYQLHLIDGQNSAADHINQIIASENLEQVGFEGQHLSYSDSIKLMDSMNAVLKPVDLDVLRQIKHASEISTLKSACLMADRACAYIRRYIQPGMTEHQIATELEWFMKNEGAEKAAFDTIVASGIRGAMPHAKASTKRVQAGEFITLDFGAQHQGYCSDMTRTFLVSGSQPQAIEEHPLYGIYQIVLQAQLAAIAAIRPGCVAVTSIGPPAMSLALRGMVTVSLITQVMRLALMSMKTRDFPRTIPLNYSPECYSPLSQAFIYPSVVVFVSKMSC